MSGDSDKTPSKVTICTYIATGLCAAATGLLAKMGLYSFAVWVFFASVLTGLLGLLFHKKLAVKAAGSLALGALLFCGVVQVVIPKSSGVSNSTLPSSFTNQSNVTLGPNSPILNLAPSSSVSGSFNNTYNFNVAPSNARPRSIEEQVRYNSKVAVAHQWQPPELQDNPKHLTDRNGNLYVIIRFGGISQTLPVGPENMETAP